MVFATLRNHRQLTDVSHLAAAAVLGCATLAASQPALAISPPITDTYITLSLPGVVGDFAGFPNAPINSIQVFSMSFGAACPGTATIACTTPDLSALSLLKQVDGASPALFLDTVKGTTFTTATLYFWKAPTSGTSYTRTYTIYLTQATIESLQQSGAQGGSPTESVSLGYQSIALQDNVSGSIQCYNQVTKATANATTC